MPVNFSKLFFIFILTISLGLAGCGGGDTNENAPTDPNTPSVNCGAPSTGDLNFQVYDNSGDLNPVEGITVATYQSNDVTIDQTATTDTCGKASFNVTGSTVTFLIADARTGDNRTIRAFIDAPVQDYTYYLNGHRESCRQNRTVAVYISQWNTYSGNHFATVGNFRSGDFFFPVTDTTKPKGIDPFPVCENYFTDPTAVDVIYGVFGVNNSYAVTTHDITLGGSIDVSFSTGLTPMLSQSWNANTALDRLYMKTASPNGVTYTVGEDWSGGTSGSVWSAHEFTNDPKRFIYTGFRRDPVFDEFDTVPDRPETNGPPTSPEASGERSWYGNSGYAPPTPPAMANVNMIDRGVSSLSYSLATRTFNFTVTPGTNSIDYVRVHINQEANRNLEWWIYAPGNRTSVALMELPAPVNTWMEHATYNRYNLNNPYYDQGGNGMTDSDYSVSIVDSTAANNYSESVPLLMLSENMLDHGAQENSAKYTMYISEPR